MLLQRGTSSALQGRIAEDRVGRETYERRKMTLRPNAFEGRLVRIKDKDSGGGNMWDIFSNESEYDGTLSNRMERILTNIEREISSKLGNVKRDCM